MDCRKKLEYWEITHTGTGRTRNWSAGLNQCVKLFTEMHTHLVPNQTNKENIVKCSSLFIYFELEFIST